VTGTIDGSTDPNRTSTLDWSAYSTPENVTLTGLGGSEGFSGTAASIGGGFTNINNLVGPATAGGTLTGMNAPAGWNVDASDLMPDYYASTITLTFTGFTQLMGGTVSDTFDIVGAEAVSLTGGGGVTDFFFRDGSSVTGTIDGGAGASSLDWSAYSTPRNVTLTSTGASHGFAGTEASIGSGFDNIDTLIGPASAGGTLTGMNAAGTWNLPADNQGVEGLGFYTAANAQDGFGGFTQLVGRGPQDTFVIEGTQPESLLKAGGSDSDFIFADGASITGTIDGSFGFSTLDWSAYSTAQNVTLTSRGFIGFGGTEASIGGGFRNIVNLIGGSSFTDSLTGMASGGTTWTLGGGTDTYQNNSNILTFSSFEQLFGPAVPDSTQTTLAAALDGQNQATLTATVTSSDGITPQGTVSFYQGTGLLGTVTLQDGLAGFTTDVLPPGQYTFTAVYSGDTGHNISVGSVDVSVAAALVPALGAAQATAAFTPASNGNTPNTSDPVTILIQPGSAPGPVATHLAVTGGRQHLGVGPDRKSATGLVATRSAGSRSMLATTNVSDHGVLPGLSPLTPIPDATKAVDEALEQWTDGLTRRDYADLALAMLSDVNSGSDRGEIAPPGRHPGKRLH
jgi:acrosin